MTYMERFYSGLLVLLSLNFTIINGNVFAQNIAIVSEAETGTLGSDFSISSDGNITYITPQTDLASATTPGDDTKVVSFSIRFSETGTYDLYIKGKVGVGNFSDDSFYIANGFGNKSSTAGADWYVVNNIVNVGNAGFNEVVTGSGSAGGQIWKWINVSEYLGGETPVTFTVASTETTYVFQYGARENGFDLDKIAFGKAELFYTIKNLENGEAGSASAPEENGVPESAYQLVKTYVNPVLPGDHPDQTLLKMGNDFYSCGSSFHFTPYLPILHSTDLVHWETISRVIPPTWNGLLNDAPAQGIWEGAITYFYNSYWIYFSNTAGGGQYFSKAASPEGPWSVPVKMNTAPDTGASGYDNSVFVDDDGTPYMTIKPGRNTNRIQQIGTDGHLTGFVINLDWVNANNEYSWAEGPVMCKRNGWYYYFVAGNVGGGQYVLRSQSLSENPDDWEALGNFFADITDPSVPFRGPNHIAQPFQLEDGTWWTLSHSYEGNGWEGQGRQGLLHQVIWDSNGKPTGVAPTTAPLTKPDLPKTGIAWSLPRSDYFANEAINLSWYFLNKTDASHYSLSQRPGWLTITPGTGRSSILQKSAEHFCSLVTRVDLDATASGEQAGIYLTNGNESVNVRLYIGYSGGKKIVFTFNKTTYEVSNTMGNTLWLKVERQEHDLSGYYSADGINWIQIGNNINVADLDKSQPEYNWWVGNSIGLYAEKKKADFDLFIYKDGFSTVAASAWNNAFGVETVSKTVGNVMVNSSDQGGWLMLGGADLGNARRVPDEILVSAAVLSAGSLEVWLDDIENEGTLIATIPVSSTGSENNWQTFSSDVSGISGQHDLYIRFSGSAKTLLLNTIRFVSDSLVTGFEQEVIKDWFTVYPNPFQDNISVDVNDSEASYAIYDVCGREVERGIINAPEYRAGDGLLPAMYMLTIQTPHRRTTVKIAKVSR